MEAGMRRELHSVLFVAGLSLLISANVASGMLDRVAPLEMFVLFLGGAIVGACGTTALRRIRTLRSIARFTATEPR